MMQFLLRVIVLLLVLYGGAKAWVFYQAEQWLGGLKEQLALHMAIDHGWIGSSLWNGELILNDVEVRPFRLRESLKAERIVLGFGNRTALFSPPRNVNDEIDLPATLHLSIQGLQVPLTPNWSEYLHLQAPLWATLAPPCGDLNVISLEGLKALDYEQLKGEARFSVESAGTPFHKMTLSVALEELADLQAGIDWASREDLQQGSLSGVRGVVLNWRDLGLLDRVALRCAPETEVTREGYHLFLRKALQEKLAAIGMTFSESLLLAMDRFLPGQQALSVQLKANPGFDPQTIGQLSPEGVSEQLPLTLAVNGQGVVDTYYEVEVAKLQAALKPPAPVVPKEPVTPVIAETEQPAAKRFQEAEPQEVDAYIGLPIKVLQKDGKSTTGVLSDVSESRLDISVPMASGDVVFHVRRRDIERLEVYR